MLTADIAVIGLGAAGAATVYQLARRGASVVGIDRFAPPHAHGSSGGETRITRQAIGEGSAYVPLVLRSHELWREIEAETGADLLTVTGGLIFAAASCTVGQHGTDDFVAGTVRAAGEFGIAHEIVDAAAIAARWPQFHLREEHHGYFEPGAGYVRPEAAIAAQLALAERHDAVLRRDTTVHAVRPVPGGVEIDTSAGPVSAAHAVVAAGPWLPELAGAALPPGLFRPYRQVLYWFDVAGAPARYDPAAFPVFIWQFNAAGDMIYGFPGVDGPGGGIKVGREEYATTTGPGAVDRAVGPHEIAAFHDGYVRDQFPGVGPRCLRARVCLYTVTPDWGFVVDHLPGTDAVTVVSACSGHGFKHSAALGEAVAQRVLAGTSDVDLAPFRLDRFLSPPSH